MPKVYHVKKARKPFTASDGKIVKVGDSYYWWKFAFGPRMSSITYPKPQQLTQSDFQISVFDIEDRINALTADDMLLSNVEEIVSDIENLHDETVSDIENLRDETQGRLDNMPEQLQEADTGQLLQERISALEEWQSELENIDFEIDNSDVEQDVLDELEIKDKEKMDDEQKKEYEELLAEKTQEFWEEKLGEVHSISYNL